MSGSLSALLGSSSGAAAPSLPLDVVSGATGAFSTRLLRTAYAGSCMKVRRSSDNTTQDIGFAAGLLDTTALASFVGANDGFVDTWYDQSGNAKNFTQSTTGHQPKLVSGGVIYTNINSQPCAYFAGTVSGVVLVGGPTSNFIAAGTHTIISTAYGGDDAQAVNGVAPGVFGTSGEDMWHAVFNASGQTGSGIYTAGMLNCQISETVPATAVRLSRYNKTNMYEYINGGAGNSIAASDDVTITNTAQLGQSYTKGLVGYIAEIVLFNTFVSAANCNALGAPMATYAGTSWSNIS